MHLPCIGSTAKAVTSPETVYSEKLPPFNGALSVSKGGPMPGKEKSAGRQGRDRTYAALRDDRIESILQTIETDLASDVAVLAQVAHLSCSRLSHLFKNQMGRSLHSYLADRRLEKAARLLRLTDTPVKEISYIVGYRHSPSFVRAFRRKFGCAPNDLRGEATKFSSGKDSCFG
jgi:AraC-like DNA-binding protein